MIRGSLVLLGTICVLAGASGTSQAQSVSTSADGAKNGTQDLKRLSIEELANLDVTTASKRVEHLSDVAAAITVIRGDDIRRAGITTLPEALRLADGLQVAQVYGPGWVISARGFNISTANKLLVMIDGRTVYSPLFSGVFWDMQDVMLADIDRIEVTRGPGGAVWGANAVNGVVNIIMKSAAETQGGYVTVTAGNETRAVASARYGATTKSGTAYRGYLKFRVDDQHVFATGAPGMDGTRFGQAGFRVDSDAVNAASWTLQGDVYSGAEGLYDRGDTIVSGGNLLARFTRRWSATSQFQTQIYYDRTSRDVQNQYHATRDTFDVDTQQLFQVGTRHHVVVGAGLRIARGDDLGDGIGFFFDPQARTNVLGSAFAEDDIQIVPRRAALIIGAKFERNDYTGSEWLPNVRLRITPSTNHTLWASISRAVRMPTRFDDDLRIKLPNGALFITGSTDFKSENVVAYEAGYRATPVEWLSFDAAVFTNRYDDLRSQELPLTVGAPIVLANGLRATTSGTELSATASLTKWWQVHGSYSYLTEAFSTAPGSRDTTNGVSEANDPSHVVALRTSLDARRVQFDAQLRHISALPNPAVAAYTELNARLAWTPTPRWELSVIGQNLLHDRHEEFAAGTPRELYERGLSLRSAWKF